MIDEYTKQERVKDFLETKPKVLPTLGIILLFLTALSITLFTEAITNKEGILGYIFKDITTIVSTLVSGILLTFSTREEYTKSKRILFIVLIVLSLTAILFQIILWTGPADLFISILINGTTIGSLIFAVKYDITKDYYIYFPVEKYGECPWKK